MKLFIDLLEDLFESFRGAVLAGTGIIPASTIFFLYALIVNSPLLIAFSFAVFAFSAFFMGLVVIHCFEEFKECREYRKNHYYV